MLVHADSKIMIDDMDEQQKVRWLEEHMGAIRSNVGKINDTVYACYYASKHGLQYKRLIAKKTAKQQEHFEEISDS